MNKKFTYPKEIECTIEMYDDTRVSELAQAIRIYERNLQHKVIKAFASEHGGLLLTDWDGVAVVQWYAELDKFIQGSKENRFMDNMEINKML